MRIFFAILILIASTSSGLAAGEECTQIGNDIQRLQCFDNAFASSQREDRIDREDAIAKLIDLVNFTSDEIVFELSRGEDPCALSAVFTKKTNAGLTDMVYIWEGYNNLSQVERIGRYDTWNRHRIYGYVLYNQRGFTGMNQYRSEYFRASPDMKAEQVNRFRVPLLNTIEGRDNIFPLVVEEYGPDAQEIRNALQVALEACKPS